MSVNDFNDATISGTITDEPMVKETNGGGLMLRLNVLSVQTYEGRDGQPVQKKSYWKFVCWNQVARRHAPTVRQGDRILCKGEVVTNAYERDGKWEYPKELKVQQLIPLGAQAMQNAQPTHTQPAFNSAPNWDNSQTSNDPIPFYALK